MGIDLMVFCYDDDGLVREDLGIEVPFEQCPLKMFTFYRIDYITLDREYPNYTTIGSGGEDFTCNERYELVKQKIENSINFKLN